MEAECEPARTMHLAWFPGPEKIGRGLFASADHFVKWDDVSLLLACSTFDESARVAVTESPGKLFYSPPPIRR